MTTISATHHNTQYPSQFPLQPSYNTHYRCSYKNARNVQMDQYPCTPMHIQQQPQQMNENIHQYVQHQQPIHTNYYYNQQIPVQTIPLTYENNTQYGQQMHPSQNNIEWQSPISDTRLMAMLSTWALELEKDKRCHMSATNGTLNERALIRIPNGTCITNPSNNKSYVIQSYLTDTLQGAMYCGLYFPHNFYERYSTQQLFELFLEAPQLAIKLCNEKHVRQGTNIENHVVLENADEEWQMNSDIYKYAEKLQPLQSWLPPPKLNFATPIGSWEDSTLHCSWMITELANLGEFIEIVKHLHPKMYPEHHNFLQTLKLLSPTATTADDKTTEYNIYLHNNKEFCSNVLCTPMTGTNFYIELVRCIMQQLCQSTAVMHSYSIAHLDLSIENIVLQFNPKDVHPLLCKVIDFGRAHNFRKENNNNCDDDIIVDDDEGSVDVEEQKYKFHGWAKKLDQINFAFYKHPGKTKYMSPQATMFLLNEENAFPFNACKNDIWSLGCIMFSLLTSCTMYNIATYVDSDGYLNGKRSQTLYNADKHPIDPSIQQLYNSGLEDVLQQRAASGYCNEQCISFMKQCFTIAEDDRPNIFELLQHPFLCQKPDEQLLQLAIDEIQNFALDKNTSYVKEQIKNIQKSQEYMVGNHQRQEIMHSNLKNINQQLSQQQNKQEIDTHSATVVVDDDHKKVNEEILQLRMWQKQLQTMINQENIHIQNVMKDDTICGLTQMIEGLNCEHFNLLWSKYHCFPQSPQVLAQHQLQFNQLLNCQSYIDQQNTDSTIGINDKQQMMPQITEDTAVIHSDIHKNVNSGKRVSKIVRFQVGCAFEHRHSASISPPPSSCFLLSPQCSYHSHANLAVVQNNNGGYASSHSNFDIQL